MAENKQNNFFPEGMSASGLVKRSSTETFEGAVERIKKQIDFQCFEEGEKDQAQEIALIMAEIALLPYETEVRIAKQSFQAGRVAEVYNHVTHEHVMHVMDNLSQLTCAIKYMKTYLRTALYNSVFELTSRIENRVTVAMAQDEKW